MCQVAIAGDLEPWKSHPDLAPVDVGLKNNSSLPSMPTSTAGSGINGFWETASNIKTTVSNLKFEIPNCPLEPHPERLVDRKVDSEMLLIRSDNNGPFKDYDEFKTRGLEKVSTKVRSYGIKGLLDVRIVLPDAYAKLLDEGKMIQKDIGTGKPAQRVVPADLPQLIDEMPDPRYFKRVFISDKANPEDDWVTQSYFSKGFVSATAMVDGELFLYKSNLTDYLRRDLMHEWGHELRYKYWGDPVKNLFHDAVLIETLWNPRQYAARGDSEQWAVLGERLLGTSANDFAEACLRAPIRTTIWMMALDKCLTNVPKTLWTVDQKIYKERAAYVLRDVRLQAEKSLDSMKNSETDATKLAAIKNLRDGIHKSGTAAQSN